MNERTLRRSQAVSGLVFAVFLLLHLVNQMTAAAGAQTYDAVQGTLRAGYQVPVVEVLVVLAPAVVHAVLAIMSWRRRRGQPAVALAWPARLHRWSGRVLLIFFLGHAGATRLPALLADAAPGFAGVAFTFQWIPAWFWPYYPTLALAGWYHLLFGLGSALPLLGFRGGAKLLERRVLMTVFAVGAIALLAGVLGFGAADASVRQSKYAQFWLKPEGGTASSR